MEMEEMEMEEMESVVCCYLNLTWTIFGESESVMCGFGKSGETDKCNGFATCPLLTYIMQIMKV